jgi:glycyl-tRNA synthetase beta chain
MRNYYADQGFTSAQFDAVEALVGGPSGPDLPDARSGLEGPPTVSLSDFDKRLKAVREFSKLSEAPALAAANKRIRNILRKVEGEIPTQVNAELLQEAGEKDLHVAVNAALIDTDTALAARDYVAVLSRLAILRPQVDAFFDSVMVNVEDENIRNNRLALLKQLADRFGAVAEIAQLSA